MGRMVVRLLSLVVLFSFAASGFAVEAINGEINPALKIEKHPLSGKVNFIGGRTGQRDRSQPSLVSQLAPSFISGNALGQYAPLFGIDEPSKNLILKRRALVDSSVITHYQQLHAGLPVLGAELVVNLDNQGQLVSMSGEITRAVDFSIEVNLSALQAQQIAIDAVAKWYELEKSNLTAQPAELVVYDSALLLPVKTLPVHAAWKTEITSPQHLDVREFVVVNAASGAISLHFSMIDRARQRKTYSAGGTFFLPGSLVCDESKPECTNGIDVDADFAHIYAGHAYDFFQQQHARDSIDNNGATIISSVDYFAPLNCPNAFWNGNQLIYCDGLARADDIVAHEFTHGVTDNTSNLFYYYQSGAINESLSDIWGEFVDLTNGSGNDANNVRWLMGEDAIGLGAIRDMQNPTIYGDPDRMTSTNYVVGQTDNGGVHSNSGVNNKAAYLMTDGDAFNGQTVAGLGIDKVAAIYYEVQSNLLTSASDYLDLYHALYQGCLNLIGTKNISLADCREVRKATDAVEMDLQPVAGYNPDAALCSSGEAPVNLFYDDFESGVANWNFSALIGVSNWRQETGNASSGIYSLKSPERDSLSDLLATMAADINLPAGSQAQLHFRHAFGFEEQSSQYYDGGILEYSLDSGTTWSPASILISSDGKNYDGTISSDRDNPLAGSSAFVGNSNGYVSTRLDLTALAGGSVRFRWRHASDSQIAGPLGWVIDDVRIYTCEAQPLAANAGDDQTVFVDQTVSLDAGNSTGDIASYSWSEVSVSGVTLNNANTATPSFTAPSAPAILSFEVTVTDNTTATQTDTVVINVASLPNLSANAGIDKTVNVGSGVTLDASASNGAIASYSWSQIAGTSVALPTENSAYLGFVAPLTTGRLSFELTVTDMGGNTSSDILNVDVVQPTLTANAGANFAAEVNRTTTLSAQASQGLINSYSWSQISGPTVSLNNASTSVASFTTSTAGTLEFEVTVTDIASATSSDRVVVKVYDGKFLDGGGSTLDPWLLTVIGLLALLAYRKNRQATTF